MKVIMLASAISLALLGCAAMDEIGRGLADGEKANRERNCVPGSDCFYRLSPEAQAAMLNRNNNERKRITCTTVGQFTTCEEDN